MEKNKDKDLKFYYFFRNICVFFSKLFRNPKYIGLENIPDGAFIFAGTHTCDFDFSRLMGSTKRPVRFIAKYELFKNKFIGSLFRSSGVIPVNRRRETDSVLLGEEKKEFNRGSMNEALSYLKSGGIIAIFPEGTVNKKGKELLPFKIGAVKLSVDANVPIVPFAIKYKHRYFGRVTVIFSKPIKVKGDLEKENAKLRDIIGKML